MEGDKKGQSRKERERESRGGRESRGKRKRGGLEDRDRVEGGGGGGDYRGQ